MASTSTNDELPVGQPSNQSDAAATVASKMSFMELCKLLEKLDGLKSKKGSHVTNNRKTLLRNFIDAWREFYLKVHKDATSSDSFYPVMRLLLPHLEKERLAYGIKEYTLAKLYIEVLCLGKDSNDATKLLNYKAPKVAAGNVGDFASVAFFVLKSRCPERGTLSISDVNECLDSIASNNAKKNKEAVRASIMRLLRNLSAVEQKWLIRMIMKELKCGMSQQTVFSIFHQDAEDLYNVTNSLEKVCTQLRDPDVRLHEIGITLFAPFKPMLGERGRPAEVEKLMEGKEYFVEIKYDGERMQLHKQGEEYRYFSRGGNDYSDSFGRTSYTGTISPYIHNCFLPGIDTCILDGEMMGYDPASETLGSKGENFDIKSKEVLASHGYHPCYVVFDVLLYNGKVLSNMTLRERSEYIPKIVKEVKGRISISERKLAKTNADCGDMLNEAIEKRDEGIMVKNPDSIYKPNTRNGGWFKIKPEYVGGLMDELDVLIVGGYFGVGHRAGMLSHFLCGLAVPCAEGEQPTIFHSFCKVGSGYTKKELFNLNRRLSDHWQPFSKKKPPSCLILASGLKERPDVWIDPSKSAILQVKAAEIIASDRYQTKMTLRFPRVEKIRSDKHWYECMTVTELDNIRQKSDGKLTNRYDLNDDVTGGGPSKKRRKTVKVSVRPSVPAQFRGLDASAIEKTSEILAGKELCIVNGTDGYSKTDLERKVYEFGGDVTQNPDAKSTYCVIAHKDTGIKINNYIKSGLYDVVKADWLIRCIQGNTCIAWIPSDMWYSKPSTVVDFSNHYDQHGDSYYKHTSVPLLTDVFRNINNKNSGPVISAEEISDLEAEYFPDESHYGIFRPYRLYIDDKLVINDTSTRLMDSCLTLPSLEARFHGATLVDRVNDGVSHVLISESDPSRVKQFRDLAEKRTKKFHIVKLAWIGDSLKASSPLNERHYEPAIL